MVLRATWRFGLATVLLSVGFLVGGVPAASAAKPTPRATQPARYTIVIDGLAIASFDHLVKLTTQAGEPPTLELKGPYSANRSIEAWLRANATISGGQRKDFQLVKYTSKGGPVAGYEFQGGAPTKIRVTGDRAGGSDSLVWHVTFTAIQVHSLSAGGPALPRPTQLTAARYSIVIDGVEIAAFNHLVKLTIRVGKRPFLELEDPITGEPALESWLKARARRDFRLMVYNSEGTPLAGYFFQEGAPSKIRVITDPAGSSVRDVTFTAIQEERLPIP